MRKFYTACAIAMLGLFISAAQVQAGENNNCTECNNHRVPEPSTIVLLAAGVAGLAAGKIVRNAKD